MTGHRLRNTPVESAPMLQIHEILVRIRGSIPLTMDPDPDADPDHANFRPSRRKHIFSKFFSKFFCLLLFEGTFTSFFKDEKS